MQKQRLTTQQDATCSLLRMKNLTADYLGNLEEPDKYLYTIKSGFPPVFWIFYDGNDL